MCCDWLSTLGIWIGSLTRSCVVVGCSIWVSTLGLWTGSLTRPTQESNTMCGGWVSSLGVCFKFLLWASGLSAWLSNSKLKYHVLLNVYSRSLDWQLDPPSSNIKISYAAVGRLLCVCGLAT